MKESARVFRTVRTLRWSQWVHRLSRRFDRYLGRLDIQEPTEAELQLRPAPELDSLERLKAPLYHGTFKTDELKVGVFTIHHLSKKLGHPKVDWRLGPCDHDRLWTVTLHYHEWAYELADEDKGLFKTYLADWMEFCDLAQPGARDLSWNPYAVATRIGWWVASYHRCGADFWAQEPVFQKAFLRSLWRQAEYLSKNIEWDLLANHILRDAAGLAMAGSFFGGTHAARWRKQSLDIAVGQSRKQFLGDGGHYERSPMYQVHALVDVATVALLSPDGAGKKVLLGRLPGILRVLHEMRHPDGGLVLLNDSTLNGGPDVGQTASALMEQFALPLDDGSDRGLRYLRGTGWVIWRGGPYALFFDVGPLGPDEQCGHGHADNLTLELSYEGGRLFVDTGAYSYDDDSQRAYDRSTAAHNTVCVDGVDSSEVWKIFRVGRRAKPCGVSVKTIPNGFQASASHDGYDHLPGKPRHVRSVEIVDSVLKVVDTVRGKGRHHLMGSWVLDPLWHAVWNKGEWVITQGDQRLVMRVKGPAGMTCAVGKAPYHPEFGIELTTNRLIWSWAGDLPATIESTLGPA